jgi:hypothetical protein
MNDLEIYIYIALAVIYFLSRAFRKKKSSKPPSSRPRTSSQDGYEHPTSKEKPLTFEDLLKEFTGQKEETVSEQGGDLIEVEDNDVIKEKYGNEEEIYSNEYEKQEEVQYKSYEEVYASKERLKTLDEQIQLNEPARKRFDEYKIKKKVNIHTASRFRELLKNKDSLKDAIILKEILDRKYF